MHQSNVSSFQPFTGFRPKTTNSFCKKLPRIVRCTFEKYKQIIKIFLSVPKKSHFIFNLCDLSNVFQGLSLATQKTLPELTSFIRLWVLEMRQVFSDWLLEEKVHVDLALI